MAAFLRFVAPLAALVAACSEGGPTPFAPPPPARSTAVAEPAVAVPPSAPTNVESAATETCSLVSTLEVVPPAGTDPSFVSGYAGNPREQTIPDTVLAAAESDRERIHAVLSSVLDSETRPTIEVTALRAATYRVRVRAQLEQFATCHGHYDKLDLVGTANVHDGTVEIGLDGDDRITEDVCAFDGRRPRVLVGRPLRAKATLRIARRCEAHTP